jgi:hypothetical protein
LPTTLTDNTDYLDISTPDYLGWDLGEAGNQKYQQLTEYGGGGFARGLQAMAGVQDGRTKWDVFKDEIDKAHSNRQGLGFKGTPSAILKNSLNQYIEQWDMALNTWNPTNYDAFEGVRDWGTKNLGGERAGKALQVAANVPGKVLQSAGAIGDVLDFTSRVGSGQNVVRAGAGTAGSIAGAQLGFTAGMALGAPLGPAAPIVGIIGSMVGAGLGDLATTKAYESVTEDAFEKARKLQENGIGVSPDQVKELERQGYSVEDLQNQFGGRRGEERVNSFPSGGGVASSDYAEQLRNIRERTREKVKQIRSQGNEYLSPPQLL